MKDTPNFNRKEFLYYLSRADYERRWGTTYRKPGFGARVLAFFLNIMPKVGPFSAVNFKIPTQQTEDMYIQSVDETERITPPYSTSRTPENSISPTAISIPDAKPRQARYVLTDQAYAQLLDKLSQGSFAALPPPLRQDILSF